MRGNNYKSRASQYYLGPFSVSPVIKEAQVRAEQLIERGVVRGGDWHFIGLQGNLPPS